MRALVVALLLLAVVVPGQKAGAWSSPGHMEVAAIAWSQMSTPAKDRAWELLQKHQYFAKWTQLLGPYANAPDKQRYYFMIAATWPDFIRGDSAFADDTAQQNDEPALPGFPDMWKHTDWHFVDTPYVLYANTAPPDKQIAPPGDAEAEIPVLDHMLHVESHHILNGGGERKTKHTVGS